MQACWAGRQQLVKVRNGVDQAFAQLHGGFPAEFFAGQGDVGLALLRIIRRQRTMDDLRSRVGEFQHLLGQFQHGELAGVAEVHGARKRRVRFHQAQETIDQIEKMGGDGGLIALDKDGNIAMPFNTAGMYRGAVTENGEIEIEIYK